MPHHWYAIADAQANTQRERANAAQQINAMRSNVIQTLRDFRQLVDHCDDTTFNWKDGVKVRRYWKRILNRYIDQLTSQVTAPR